MMGTLDRLMRASVERAQQMQPKRLQRAVGEHLYAAPSARDEVEAVSRAAARMVAAGLTPATSGSVAVRHSARSATITAPGADLSSIDNRNLERVGMDDTVSPALAAVRAGAPAAVWGFPSSLLALAAAGIVPEPVSEDLARLAGRIAHADTLEAADSGLTVVVGRGVVAGHTDPEAAVDRLAAAEALARMTIIKRTLGSSHG
jgi:ribulose-5-phosphate 4-epimerase/fuculose-1-phosphate aldolase